MPLEHFEAEEKAHLLSPPTERYDIPRWSEPKVARDQHAQVDSALYSLPTAYVGKKLRARADRATVRFYDRGVIVKVHARVLPGRRATDPNDFPPEKTAYAMRDIDFLKHQAESHGPNIGLFAARILDCPLPWTRMRRVYALLGLVKKYGEARVDGACATALVFDMDDVRRLKRMLENATAKPLIDSAEPKVIPLARYLRPTSQYALPLASPERSSTPSTQEMTDDTH